MHAAIARMLMNCGGAESRLPPTLLFNEGWMLRLILDWMDRERGLSHPLAFVSGARWYSEALLASRFLPVSRGDRLAEGYTHADAVVGHFSIDPGNRGEAILCPDARQFVVIEAKLNSPLSAGTRNAPAYDQAARNVACMAHMIDRAGLRPEAFSRLAFFVIAPQTQIDAGTFGILVTKSSIEQKVRSRIASFDGRHQAFLEDVFLPVLDKIHLEILSWESVLAAMPNVPDVKLIMDFYARCLTFNMNRAVRQTEAVADV